MSTATKKTAVLPEVTNIGSAVDKALDAGKGILRLSPTWVPRSFLHPGKRVRLQLVEESPDQLEPPVLA